MTRRKSDGHSRPHVEVVGERAIRLGGEVGMNDDTTSGRVNNNNDDDRGRRKGQVRKRSNEPSKHEITNWQEHVSDWVEIVGWCIRLVRWIPAKKYPPSSLVRAGTSPRIFAHEWTGLAP